MKITAEEDIAGMVADARHMFETGKTRSFEYRHKQLTQVYKMLDDNREAWSEALKADLGKPKFESLVMELTASMGEIANSINNLKKWMEPERPSVALVHKLNICEVVPEPLGTALIISPWNYPLYLCAVPLAGAIAAGSAAVLKPSEMAPHTSKLLAELVPRYLDSTVYKVVEGGIPETTALLKQRWDKIFYTGNGAVGKIVMRAAAEFLTPVVLELGGKNPAIVCSDSDMRLTARRIAWGKWANNGQTCVAPDYILCTKEVVEPLVAELKKAVDEFYGSDAQKSTSYGRIINERHVDRLQHMLDTHGGKVAFGGRVDRADKYIDPTVVISPDLSSPIMTEEVFGPLVSIITVPDVHSAVRFINDREKPLSLYLFTNDKTVHSQVLSCTSSGGVCVNDTIMQISVSQLPFGGVGASGTGAYHGKSSFDTFSHFKSVMIRKQNMEGVLRIRYPPYKEKHVGYLEMLLEKPHSGMSALAKLVLAGGVVCTAAILKSKL